MIADPWWNAICKIGDSEETKHRKFAEAMRWIDEDGTIKVPERYAEGYSSYRDFMGREDDEALTLELQYWGFISRIPLKEVNLLQETLRKLKANSKTPDDVLWIGDWYESYSWDEFAKVADFIYLPKARIFDPQTLDPRSTIDALCSGFKIVGEDWWLERAEYWDRSEGWEFKTLPKRPKCGDGALTKEYFDYRVGNMRR
jgi:hypothetical protein